MDDIKFKVGQRLLEIRKANSKSQAEVAEYLGLTVGAYQNYEAGRREAGYAVISKLADFYCVPTDYLLGREKHSVHYHEGLEVRLKETYQKLPQDVRANILQAMLDAVLGYQKEQSKPITITIRKHISKAAAGSGYDLDNEDHWERVPVVKTQDAECADFAVEVEGDSMLPDYHDGDLVLIKQCDDIEVGQVGLFIQNGKGFIKQKGEKHLVSLNPDYPGIYPEDGEIVCRGRIIGVAELPE